MATILKNNIKPKGSTLKGLVATDASGNKRDVKFVRQVNGNGVATTVYDTFKEYAYGDINISAFSYGDIPANGGKVTPTALTYSQVRTEKGESGASYGTATLNSGATVTYSGTGVNSSTGEVSAASLTSTERARTKITTVTVTIKLNGKTATKTFDVYQAANAFVNYSYDAPTGLSISAGLVPAGGGSVTSGTVNGTCSQVRRYNYTAGNDQKRDTINPTYSGSWSGGASNIGSRGANVDTANTSTGKTLTYTYTANGKSNTATCTVYQQRNVADASSKITAYGNVTCSASVGDIPAGGGSVTVSRSASQTRTRQYYYTSGTAGRTASENCTITWNTTDVTASANGLRTTEKARTAIKTFNYTATGEGSKSNTCSCTAYQAANVRTKNTGAMKSYGTPTISIGSGLTAKGGSATVTHSVKNSRYYYYTYTDTSANEGVTAHYEDVTGTTTIAISSNGNNRFSLSGNTLTHSNMTTNAVTDTVKVKATNSGDTSKTAEATASVTNGYTDSWNNPSVTAFGYATNSFTFSGGSSAAPNSKTATQSGTRTFDTGSTSTISNSTFTWSYSTSSTGFSVNSSTGVVTAGTNSATTARSGVITATATANGKTGSKTFTFSQGINPYNGHDYVDLGLPSGIKVAKFNVGASKPEEYGNYFMWGSVTPNDNDDCNWRTVPHHTGSSSSSGWTKYNTDSSYGTVDNKTVLDLIDDAAHVNMGGSWRMPTSTEIQEIFGSNFSYARLNDVQGRKRGDLFVPCAGHRFNVQFNSQNGTGYVLSSSLYTSPDSAYVLTFNYSINAPSVNIKRCMGCSIRGVVK